MSWETDPIAPDATVSDASDWWKNDPVAPEYPDYSGEGQIQDVIAKYTPPEWATKAAKGVSKFVSENVPHAFSEAPAFASPLNIRGMYDEGKQNYQIIKDVASGMSVDEATRKNAPERLELKDALQMPLGSQEQYDVGAKLLGAGAMVGLPFLHKGATRPGLRSSETGAAAAKVADAARSEPQSVPQIPSESAGISGQKVQTDSSAGKVAAEQIKPDVSQPEATSAPAGPQAQSTTSVPVMITKQMESDLRGLGVSDEQIYRMTPAEAHEILRSRSDPGISEVLSGFKKKYKPSYIGEDYANISPETGSVGKEKGSGPVLGESNLPPEQPSIPLDQPGVQGESVPTSTKEPIGVAERYAEAEQPGTVIPGTRENAEYWRQKGRSFINEGGDPRMPIRAAQAGHVSPRNVGIVSAEYERLTQLKRQAADSLEAFPTNPELQKNFKAASDAWQSWRREMQPVLTRAGESLAAAIGEHPVDLSTFDGLHTEAMKLNGGQELTPSQKAGLIKRAGLGKRFKAAEAKSVDRLQQEIDRTLPKRNVPTEQEMAAIIEDKIRKLTPCQ